VTPDSDALPADRHHFRDAQRSDQFAHMLDLFQMAEPFDHTLGCIRRQQPIASHAKLVFDLCPCERVGGVAKRNGAAVTVDRAWVVVRV